MTRCGPSYVERQFTMLVNRNNQKYKAAATAPLPKPKKTKQISPEPKTGSRPKIRMFVTFPDEENIPVLILLDTGCDTPMMSK
jgi:hypothetical protein